MVFILIGAVQAAKIAKAEYDKDRKRNAQILPVEGSSQMVADRGGSVVAAAHADNWYGDPRPHTAHRPSTQSPTPLHSGLGAWSRDTASQQSDATCVSSPSVDMRPQPSQSSLESDVESLKAVDGTLEDAADAELSPRGETLERVPRGEPRRQKAPRPASAPTPGSFAAAMHAQRKEQQGGKDPSLEETLVERTAVTKVVVEEQRTVRSKSKVAVGSFAAALRDESNALRKRNSTKERALAAMARKRSSAVPRTDMTDAKFVTIQKEDGGQTDGKAPTGQNGTRRPADGSFAAAVHTDVLVKTQNTGGDVVVTERAETVVQVNRVTKKKSARAATGPPPPEDGSFAAAMRRNSARDGRPVGETARADNASGQTSAMAYQPGSKVKAKRPTRPAQGEASVDMSGSASSTSSLAGAGSSMSAQGTMKKRISKRA